MSRIFPTIKEVAVEAEVSPTSVSLYLNDKPGLSEETRQRIAHAIEKLGYVPRGHKRSTQPRLVGLLVEQWPLPAFSDVFYAEIVQGVENRARQLGYHTVLTVLDPHDGNSVPRAIAERQVAGVIALGGGDLTDRLITNIIEYQVPVVLVDNYLIEPSVDCVLPDNNLGGYLATRHLIERGHRRIAAIMGPGKYKPLADRALGYVRAMMEADLRLEPDLIQHALSQGIPNKGYPEMRALLALPQWPTAVFCVSDRTAFGALAAIHDAGLRVPDDISVVGFDNVRQAEHADPPLTTVHAPKREMGLVAVDRLVQLINKVSADISSLKLVLPTRLVVRTSS